jgi:hypothetical protein
MPVSDNLPANAKDHWSMPAHERCECRFGCLVALRRES